MGKRTIGLAARRRATDPRAGGSFASRRSGSFAAIVVVALASGVLGGCADSGSKAPTSTRPAPLATNQLRVRSYRHRAEQVCAEANRQRRHFPRPGQFVPLRRGLEVHAQITSREITLLRALGPPPSQTAAELLASIEAGLGSIKMALARSPTQSAALREARARAAQLRARATQRAREAGFAQCAAA
jgi:hypothetical protein